MRLTANVDQQQLVLLDHVFAVFLVVATSYVEQAVNQKGSKTGSRPDFL